MTIQFIKIARYELKPLGTDVFQYLCDLALQRIDPPSLEPGSLDVKATMVFHSNLRRAAECIKRRPDTLYVATTLLREIPFDIRKMCTRSEWERRGSVLIRRKFKECFMKDSLPVKRSQIFREIKELLTEINGFSQSGGVAAVSHSFRLKIIEAFIKSGGRLEETPDLIHRYLDDDAKTYDFKKGFSVRNCELRKCLKF